MPPILRSTLLSLMLTPCIAAPVAAHGSIEVEEGVRIRLVESGPKDSARSVLLIPGWGFSAEVWEAQQRALSRQLRVVAIDPRSQGQSTRTENANTPEARAGDIEGIMKSLDLRQVVLVGWSQGVQDVVSHASRFGGERIAGYVLVDAAVSSGPELVVQSPKAVQTLLARLGIYAAHQEPYLNGMMQAIFAKPLDEAQAQRYVATAMRTPTTTGLAMLVADMLTVDRRPYLQQLKRPTLIVASATSDELEAQRSMQREIPDARIVEVEQAGHAVFVDQPEKFNAALIDFIGKLPPVQ